MTRRAGCTAALLCALALRAEGHQIDEYVQAARLDISRGGVAIDLTLTPGIAVAQAVFDRIDRNRDGHASPDEVRDYAADVARDLSVTVDGQRYPLTVTHAESSSRDELQDGAGVIRLKASAVMPPLGGGAHRVRFENAHQPSIAVYLVNALVPSDGAVVVRAQQRDRLQRGVDVDVEVAAVHDGAATAVVLLGALALVMSRRASSAHPR